jgi:hypothetical protein
VNDELCTCADRYSHYAFLFDMSCKEAQSKWICLASKHKMDSKTKGKMISEVLMMMKMWLVVCWVVI